MQSTKTLSLLSVSLVLTACGGGGGGGFGAFSTSTLNAQATYAENVADTASVFLADDGIAGTVAVAPGIGSSAELQTIKVRASSDYQTIYVSINGGSEFPLTASFASDENGGGYGPTGLNGNFVGLSNLGNVSLIGRTVGSSGGFGHAGIMTPIANLPTGDVTYTGSWSGWVNPQSVSNLTSGVGGGSMSITFMPGSGDIDGTFSGTLGIGDLSGSTDYAIAGVVTGSMNGSAFGGTLTANSGTWQGSAALGGAFYGFDGDEAAGAFAGSISGGSGDHPFYGRFDVSD